MTRYQDEQVVLTSPCASRRATRLSACTFASSPKRALRSLDSVERSASTVDTFASCSDGPQLSICMA